MSECPHCKDNTKYDEALAFATEKHKDQKRKYTDEPYIIHPIEVANIIWEATRDINMRCAAVLHDVVEDCGVSILEVEAKFGTDVADLVFWLTDVSRPEDGTRAVRKLIDLKHTAAALPRAKTIKLADFLSNMKNLVDLDPKFAKVYAKEKRALLPHLIGGDRELYVRASALLQQVEDKLGLA